MRTRALLIIGASLLAMGGRAGGQTVIHVDDDAPPNGDGTTWLTAYRFLQDALSDASSITPSVEIRVAQGVYAPDESKDAPDGTGNQLVSFALLDGVSLRGGYAGIGRSDPDQRDPVAFPSVLTGDLGDDDGRGFERIDDNAAHVVTAIDVDATAELDGFVVTGGNADFLSVRRGGGLWIDRGSPTVRDCLFTANHAYVGAAASGQGGSPTFIRCDMSGNASGLTGGGVDFQGDATPAFYNCRIASNRAFRSAGVALGSQNGSGDPFMVNTVIANNVATDGSGGGFVASNGSKATLINCTIVNNTAQTGFIGGVRVQSLSLVTLRNCIVWGNRDASGTTELTQITREAGGAVEIDFTTIQNWSGQFGGEGNIGGSGSPGFIDPDGPDNDPLTWLDNNYRLGGGSIAVDAGRNASVPPDAPDLDGNGDTGKPISVDYDGAPRFIDDKAVRDTGDGRPPIVDMGAYERDPAAYEAQFPTRARYWVGGDGTFSDDARWLDGAPASAEQAVFATAGASAVTTSGPVIVDALTVNDGVVDLSIDASFTCTDQLRVGAASPRLTVTGGTLTAREIVVEGINAAFRTGSAIVGDVRNFGSFGSIAAPGEIIVDGDYRQIERVNGQERAGDLIIQVGGDGTCTAVDTLVVGGTAALGGGLVLNVGAGCVGGTDLSSVTILSATDVDAGANRFDGVTNLPVFADGSFGRVVYQAQSTIGAGEPTFRVVLEITTPTELLSRLNPLASSIASGDPTAAVMDDFDGDGDDDVAITLLGPAGTPGDVLILRSDGAGGLDAVDQVSVGIEPRGITSGPLDGNASVDLAVTNAAGESITILTNDGKGDFAATGLVFIGRPDDVEPIDNRPIGITAFRRLPGSTLGSFSLDLAVANSGSNTMSVVANNGIAGFQQVQLRETGAGPRSIAWVDIDEDKDLDLVVTNFASDSISIFGNNGNGGFQTLASVTVGDLPSEILVGDVNADDKGDLLISSAGNGTISVLIGVGDGTFRPPFPVTMTGDAETANVLSFTALDLDGDDDDDLVAVVAANDTTDVWQARNAYEGEADQVSFLAPGTLEDATGAMLVVSGDVNGDSQDDVVAIGAGGPGGAGGAAGGGDQPRFVLRAFENCAKLGDLNADCVVDENDLVQLVESWGACPMDAACPADLDGDGRVGFGDLTKLLASWDG